LLLEVAPEATPVTRVVREQGEVAEAIASFGSTPVAVKPSGLTGGKGVKVMGPHLANHAAAGEYASELLARGRPGESVLIEEKILGAEFTIQAISDGRTVIFPPSTYDYPFRFDGDEGPGTGGMGSLSTAGSTLPFMVSGHYTQACSIIERVIQRLAEQGRHFSGVMNSGFFATADGVKVIEFNARFGDPECMNIMSLFNGSWPAAMERISAGSLTPADVSLRKEASVVLYLVSPDYALGALSAGAGAPHRPYEFTLDRTRVEAAGAQAFFSSAIEIGENRYATVGTSRAVALCATAPTLERARVRVADCAASVPVLEWRKDVGDERYLEGLRALMAAPVSAEPGRLLSDAV